MNFDPFKLIIILIGTLFLGAFAWLLARGWAQRLMVLALLGGLALYSGIGSADAAVSPYFIAYYFILFISIIVGFHFARIIFLPASVTIGRKIPEILDTLERNGIWYFVIIAYVLLSAYSLVWPEFKLHQLISPPSPDLRTVFYQRFADLPPDAVSKLLEYVRLLMTPFFFTALYVLRHRLRRIVVIFFLLLYMEYVSKASIGRGDVMMYIGYIVLAIWFLRPRYRKLVVALGLIATPLIFVGLHWYSVIRIGGGFSGAGLSDAMMAVLETELGFIRNVGQPIVDAGARVDLMKYFTWILTLPIPKILTGPIEGARINYEISELVLGLPIGSLGWYVVLPGLVAESIYIYGLRFFWLHGIFIGILAAFFARVAERVPQFLFLYVHVVLLFGYVLNRGGISALLPVVINEFLLFYIFLFVAALRNKRKAKSSPRVPDVHPLGGVAR